MPSLWSQTLGLSFGSGYHLMAGVPGTDVENESEQEEGAEVREVPGGDASNVLLRIASPEDIAWPLELF